MGRGRLRRGERQERDVRDALDRGALRLRPQHEGVVAGRVELHLVIGTQPVRAAGGGQVHHRRQHPGREPAAEGPVADVLIGRGPGGRWSPEACFGPLARITTTSPGPGGVR